MKISNLLTATTLLATSMLAGCATPLPADPDDYSYEQSVEQFQVAKAKIGKKESDAIFGACSKSVSNQISSIVNFNDVTQAINICYIKAVK